MFLKKYGVKDGDILLVISDIDENNEILKAAEVWANLAKDGANLSILDNMDENHLRFLLLSNVELMSQLRKTCAELFDAIIRRRVSVDNLKMLIRQFIKDENESSETSERSSEIRRFNEEQQRKMDENLRRKNIKRNLKNAIENIPDTFTSHSMLFLNCQLNDHPVFGFVDTGAQATLLSEDCARRVDLFKLVDPNWGGKAKGIGVQKFIGRIHMAILKIGESELPISLCVLPYQAMDILIGLDVLKMYRVSNTPL
ncbi:hypothetical protein O3M35_013178 [Rhynocoris fuscipes]|uniref:Aspartic peptidase DDI1-type domain-containing protein n=1 Tax=Rhynocoris fuscipes TaxID=488301 RepID=A0AAW1CGY6_9HEMI